jgi:hypothetical protein
LVFQAALCAIGFKKVKWVAKSVAQQLATAALLDRIQTDISQKYKIGDKSKGVATAL